MQEDDCPNSDEDLNIDLDVIGAAAQEMLLNSNILRRPSIQAKGPNQRRAIIHWME